MDSSSYSSVNKQCSFAQYARPQLEAGKKELFRTSVLDDSNSIYRFNIGPVEAEGNRLYVLGLSRICYLPNCTNACLLTQLLKHSSDPTSPSSLKLCVESASSFNSNKNLRSKDTTSTNQKAKLEQEIELELEIEAEILNKCRKLCAKIPDEMEEIMEPCIDPCSSEEFDFKTIQDLPEIALQSKEESKKVQAYINSLQSPALDSVFQIFKEKIGTFMTHEIGYYLLKGLIILSEDFKQSCQNYSLKNFESLITNRYAVRVIKCFLSSESFCMQALRKYRSSFDRLIGSIHAVLILSSLICKATEEQSIEFVIHKLAEQKFYDKESLWLRVLSSLIDRVSGENLRKISWIVAPHIRWLIDHRLGIFGIQSLIRKRDLATIKKVEQYIMENPINFFIRKNRRFVFIEVLKSISNERYFTLEQTLQKIIYNSNFVRLIVKREDTAWLLKALIWKVCSKNLSALSIVVKKLARMAGESIRQEEQVHNLNRILDFSRCMFEGDYKKLHNITAH
jgi:hypothetical protein